MDILLYIIVILLGINILRILLTKFYNGNAFMHTRLGEADKLAKKAAQRSKAKKLVKKILDSLYTIFSSYAFFNVSEDTMEQYKNWAERLELKICDNVLSNKDFFSMRCCIMTVYFIIVSILSVNNLVFIIGYAFFGLSGHLFDIVITAEISERDKQIEKDIYRLYSDIYYVYKHKENETKAPSEVLANYLNIAEPETKKMIERFILNSKISEDEAIDSLRRNYKNPEIYDLCNHFKMIAHGKALCIETLENKKQVLDAKRYQEEEEMIEKVLSKCTFVVMITNAILIEIAIYWNLHG